MYFPTLNTMRRFQIDSFLTTKLDVWLGTRRKAVRKYLSPIQFSLDCGINEETSLALFALCVDNAVRILKQRYQVECSCNRILGVYDLPSDIPQLIYCPECGRKINVSKDMIVIWFELIQEPEEQPFEIYGRHQFAMVSGDTVGKDISLRPERIEKSSNEAVRRLFSGFNERLRGS